MAQLDRRGLHWDGTINAGHLLTAGVVAVSMIGGIFGILSRVDYANDKVEGLDKTMQGTNTRLAHVEDKMSELVKLQTQADGEHARVTDLESRVHDLEKAKWSRK